MIIDTHCHYNLEPLFEQDTDSWRDHWKAAQEKGVTQSIVVGTNITTSTRAVELCQQESKFRASVGFHPHSIFDSIAENQPVTESQIDDWVIHLQAILDKDKNTFYIAAIGEIGLDYFHLDLENPEHKAQAELQKYLFIKQIELADRYLLPLILHVRDTGTAAYSQTLELLKSHKKSNLPFVLHCISGSIEYVQEALKLGAFVGVAGNVTYKNADLIRQLVAIVPKDRLLLETDAPYLPPHPHRGKTCEPWMIQLTASYLEEHCQVSLDQVYTNTFQVFTTLRTT